ncbi:MAG: hypothetical protein JST62_14665 [Bacteroidetes bacterium]|nr:hypothetical protein [Bacteroidota bacterium]
MTIFNVAIPDNKTSFFLQFLELLGVEYKKEKEDVYELSEQQKKNLDNQEDLPLSEYQDNDEFLSELKKEYDL